MENKIRVGVSGLHCASCAKIVETELKKNPGVISVQVNPLTEEADLEFEPKLFSPLAANKNLKKLGYSLKFPARLSVPGQEDPTGAGLNDSINDLNDPMNNLSDSINDLSDLKDKKLAELKSQKQKLKIALPLMSLILIAVFWSLGAGYFKFTPVELIPETIFLPLVFLVATLVIFWLGRDFLAGAGRFFRYGRANMDTLIGIGTGTAYFYSTLIYLFPVLRRALNLSESYFFDVTIVVITLVYLGKYLENKAKLRTNDTIEKLINLQSKTALVEINGQKIEKPLNELKIGDIVIVKPGMKIPADGVVISGASAVDEALITGESLPIDKSVGDEVIGSTLNKQGVLKIRINKVGAETAIASIIKAIGDAQNSKAPIQKLADKVAGVFVPIVLALAVLVLGAWLIIGSRYLGWTEAVSLGLTCFISFLAIACPCALGLATPTGIIVGLGLASKNGLLIKNADSLEKFGRVKIIALDKTGTITSGQPAVTEIIALAYYRTEVISLPEIITLAASLENNSEHPLAQAVTSRARQENIALIPVLEFSATAGQGVSGVINGKKYQLGNVRMMQESGLTLPLDKIASLEKAGQTSIILSTGKNILGIIAVADTIKPGAAAAIAGLKNLGLKTVMLSGDRYAPARHIADLAGIDEVIAEISPLEKADKIKKLKKSGQLVAMVGDGVNDAVALTAADIGIAMATGSDVAIESADITVLHGDLSKIIKALKISRLTIRKIKQNLFWAFFYNIIALPLAAGAFYPAYGLLLSPIIAAGAMSFSSVSVIFNTLLMRRVKI
ncbi:MAG: heavy metal translocating P-type ATPase [Candidatus Falkowbacteria bacterium]|nr:heavy metal translocating P-type ATPase [Candidatus Falkowbacteria bacterium]